MDDCRTVKTGDELPLEIQRRVKTNKRAPMTRSNSNPRVPINRQREEKEVNSLQVEASQTAQSRILELQARDQNNPEEFDENRATIEHFQQQNHQNKCHIKPKMSSPKPKAQQVHDHAKSKISNFYNFLKKCQSTFFNINYHKRSKTKLRSCQLRAGLQTMKQNGSAVTLPRSYCVVFSIVYLTLSAILLISSQLEWSQHSSSDGVLPRSARKTSLLADALQLKPTDRFASTRKHNYDNRHGDWTFLFNNNLNKLNDQADRDHSISKRSDDYNERRNQATSSTGNRRSNRNQDSAARYASESQQSTSVSGGGLLVCPEGWQQHSGQCYRFFQQRRSWSRARETCERYGAQLALVLDYQQNNFTGQLASAQFGRFSSESGSLATGNYVNARQKQILNGAGGGSASNKQSQHGTQAIYATDERSYWIGFRTLDRLETNTLESAANTFISKYLGFWDFNEPQPAQGDCVRATVRHESLAPASSNSYKLNGVSSSQSLIGK